MKENMFRKGLVVGIIFLFIGMSAIPSTGTTIKQQFIMPTIRGNTLYVGGIGPDNYTSIQEAINDAHDGDTVFIYDESSPYFENLIVDKSINLIGENRETTVIDGNYIGDAVDITTDWINISGFTILNSCCWNAGIVINSNFNTVIGNNIMNNDYGIYLRGSNNIVTGNNIMNNDYGIDLRDSNNTITGNTISDNLKCIDIWSANNNIISGNIISNNWGSLSLYSSNNTNVLDNSFFNDGLFVDDSYHNNVENNTVNGKPLVYLEDESDYIITDDGQGIGQLILVNCNNITVENLNLSDANIGIQLWGTYNSKIRNNNYSNNDYGIYLDDSSSNTITGNIISNNDYGILFHESSNYNAITGNNINSNNYYGIRLDDSSSNTIMDNINSNNGGGIYLYFSDSNTITGNFISNNGDGIWLTGWVGVVGGSNDNIITGNNITSNNYIGIRLNVFSSNNIIYHNNFINNSQNANDEGDNTWDNDYTSGGNYWDDYTGEDNDGDGIGDTPYPVPGGDNNDRYPLVYPLDNHPPDAPTIEGPINGRVGEAYDYTFNAVDPDGDNISYLIDWGDGTSDGWTNYYESGQYFTITHTWNKIDHFTISCKAKDIYNVESEWGTLTVTMPRDKATHDSLSLWFLERFPILQKLLLLMK